MNIQQLLYLVELQKHHSMSAASRELHLTPQALSIAIKTLESELGFSLLEKTYSGSTLTKNGKAFAQITENFLADIEKIKSETYATIAEDTSTTILFPTTLAICSNHLDLIYRYAETKKLNLKIEYIVDSQENLKTKVQNGELPYAFIYQSYLDGSATNLANDLVFHSIKDLHTVILVSKTHPLAKYKTISLKTAFQYPMIIPKGTKDQLEEVFTHYGQPSDIKEIPSYDLMIPTLQNGRHFSLTHKKQIKSRKENDIFAEIVVKTKYYTQFGFIRNNETALNKEQLNALQFLTRFFEKNFNEEKLL